MADKDVKSGIISSTLTKLNFVRFIIIVSILVTYIYTIWGGLNLIGKPFPGFTYTHHGIIQVFLLPDWSAWGKGLLNGMTIRKLNGRDFNNSGRLLEKELESQPVGTVFSYQVYKGKKELREVNLPTMKYRTSDFIQVFGLVILASFIPLSAGLLILFLRPRESYSMGQMFFYFTHVFWFLSQLISNLNSFTHYFYICATAVLGGSYFHLALTLFEEPRFFKNRPWRYSLLYLFSVPVTVLGEIIGLAFDLPGLRFYTFLFAIVYLIIGSTLMLLITLKARFTCNDPHIRQRARLIMVGVFVSFPLISAYFVMLIIGSPVPLSYLYVPCCTFGVAIAYSALRHNLFEVSEIVKKAIIYAFTVSITGGVYAVIIWVLNQNFKGLPLYESPSFYPFLVLFFLYLFLFFKHRIQAFIDKIFFRTKIDYEKVEEEVEHGLSLNMNDASIVEFMDKTITNNFMLTGVEILIGDDVMGEFRSFTGNFIFNNEEEIVKVVKSARRLISHNEIMNDPKLAKVRNKCLAQMARIEAVFMLPFFHRGRMTVIIALGERKSAEESFNLKDIGLLHFIGQQMAVALENSRLYRSLEDAKRELQAFNTLLEYDVKERTQELENKSQELEAANLQIATAIRNKSEFVATMSHELRTPLSGILGFTDIVLEGIYGNIPPEVKDVLKDLKANGKDLLQIINDILDLSKIEAGKMELRVEKFSPRDTVEIIVGQMVGEAEKKGMKIKGEFAPNLPLGWGEEKRIKQVLETLLRNVVRHSKAKEVKIWVKVIEKDLLFEIEDNGIGIPKERLEHIFEEHEIRESLELKGYKGVGLGLALSKKWVELHEGKIYADSEIGRGSKFSFSLPLKESIAPCLPAGRPLPTEGEYTEIEYSHLMAEKSQEEKLKEIEIDKHLYEDLKGKKILSIEDNPANQKILHDLLAMHDCIVIDAWNGREGLEKAKTEKPDIIITDLQLPEMDGLQVIREIRKDPDPAISKVPIIIASSYAMLDDWQKGMDAGANTYVAKPYNFKEVLTTLTKLLKLQP